ncbi:Smr/MutS family protein [Alistipes sp.]|uniref:endonuclease MutS2 n=1 Tax=Alistipes sp. TaxID=1872444 RepID=UPI0025BC651E|nr:Smr/MutS family protein [Alistipes sp.]MCI7139661.1 Smr/MutS family protein [Alistipes sp.]MDY5396626.1 Smr/MutS family protein [Alistipes sp.]
MIYPATFEQKIGFDRLREQVAALCSMRAARERLAAEGFSTSAREIEQRQILSDEMRLLLEMERDFPGGDYPDIDFLAAKLRVEGSFLDVEEVMTLHGALSALGGVVSFIRAREERYPALYALTRDIAAFPEIVQRIETILDRFGNVRDNASPALLQIRRAIREREGQAAKRLQAVLASAKGAGIVDADAQISIRDGRAVIPVSASNKRKLNGFIHDESATGKTFYVEPVEVVEINNELRELEYAERREIVRILSEFTDAIRPDTESIAVSGDYLAEIDMLRAKGRWASENGCVKPILSTDDRLVLRNARHPLLQQTLRAAGREIVPLDLQLDRRKHILVISGPNAGGKSVCLKTTGIVQYMFQCGFPVPASENSELPVFRSLFIDIGDEQSIDNDLSTYSSHLLNMKHMLAGASDRTLVLIDEFGSGTEPTIGGAIAEAILEKLLEKGCYGVITTHYANIKYYASNTEGIANGAMQFDVQHIRPLFRLEMGKPGSSFAVEIARKIGLPEEIIRAASEKAGSDHINIERQLREIARDKHYWEQKRDRIRLTDRKVEELEQSYSEQLAGIRAERQEILRRAKQEAQQLIADANRQIENTIRTIREAQAEKELTRLARRELEDFREQQVARADDAERDAAVSREIERIERRRQRRAERKAREGAAAPAAPAPEAEKPREVVEGSKVRMEGQDMVGIVQSIKGNRAQVAFGQILTTVDRRRLQVVSNSEYREATRPVAPRTVVSADISARKLRFRDHIDVRGMRAAEALEQVQDFIDDALMVGVSSVSILHGKGTGALKEEIRRYLRSVPEVVSAVDEHADRGGAGITIVTFDLS